MTAGSSFFDQLVFDGGLFELLTKSEAAWFDEDLALAGSSATIVDDEPSRPLVWPAALPAFRLPFVDGDIVSTVAATVVDTDDAPVSRPWIAPASLPVFVDGDTVELTPFDEEPWQSPVPIVNAAAKPPLQAQTDTDDIEYLAFDEEPWKPPAPAVVVLRVPTYVDDEIASTPTLGVDEEPWKPPPPQPVLERPLPPIDPDEVAITPPDEDFWTNAVAPVAPAPPPKQALVDDDAIEYIGFDEEPWVPPAPAPVALRPLPPIDPDEVANTPPDEDFWTNAVAPVAPAPPPKQALVDDDAIEYIGFDEEPWVPPAPAPVALRPLPPIDPDELANTPPDEDFWTNPVAPVVPAPPPKQALVDDDAIEFLGIDEEPWVPPAPAPVALRPLPPIDPDELANTPPDEDFWTNPVAPVAPAPPPKQALVDDDAIEFLGIDEEPWAPPPPARVALRPLPPIDPDEVANTPPDEDFWTNPVAPVAPAPPPKQALLDDDAIEFLGIDEEPWVPPPPAPVALRPLPPIDPDELENTPPDEDFWVNPVAPVAPAPPPKQALLDDDAIEFLGIDEEPWVPPAPAPVALRPLPPIDPDELANTPPDEDFWTNPVGPVAPTPPPLQAITDDDAIEYLAFDEESEPQRVQARVLFRVPPPIDPDEVANVPPDEDFWTNPVAPVAPAPPPLQAITDDDAIEYLAFDEEPLLRLWQAPTIITLPPPAIDDPIGVRVPPPPPPRPRPIQRGGPAGGMGGGGYLSDPECGPDEEWDPILGRCVPQRTEKVFEELGGLPAPIAGAAAGPRAMYQVAKLLGPGMAGYAATKLAGKMVSDKLGKSAGTAANVGAFATIAKVSTWTRLKPHQQRLVLGAAIGSVDDLVQRYLEDPKAKPIYRKVPTSEKLQATAKALDLPIEVKGITHWRKSDGKKLLVLRYLVRVDSIILYWQEARVVEFGDVDLTGTLFEHLRKTRKPT